MKQYLLFTIFFFFTHLLSAQSTLPNSPRGNALGGTSLNFSDASSVFGNQAGLANIETWASMLYAERRFMRSPINSFAGAAVIPSGFGAFALSVHQYGIEAFNEQKIGFAYARKLGEDFSIGGQFDLLNVNISDFGSKATVTFELGMQAKISKDLQLGVHLYSPAEVQISEDFRIPSIYRVGVAYTPSPKTFLTIEAEKDIDLPTRVRTGIEYRASEQFFMRFGFATNPNLVTFGLGVISKKGLVVDVTSSYHQVLGITPSIGITFSPKNAKT